MKDFFDQKQKEYSENLKKIKEDIARLSIDEKRLEGALLHNQEVIKFYEAQENACPATPPEETES
tara:strand:+ start:125 stop:319 length:195 start_codon:yes stop_codon:yes gene_type:complete